MRMEENMQGDIDAGKVQKIFAKFYSFRRRQMV